MGNRLHCRVKRTMEDIQQCQDCQGNGVMPNPERPPRLMDCATCNGQGFIEHRAPYRLADGTWSDGVERTHVIPSHEFSKANPDRIYVHTSCDPETLGKWQPLFDVWRGDTCIKTGWPFAEAIAYADHHARTTKNGDA